MATNSESPYVIERGPGYETTVTLSEYRLRISGATTKPEWDVADDYSVVDGDSPGFRIVEGQPDKQKPLACYKCRNGRREICVSATIVHRLLPVEGDDRVVVYDRDDEAGLRVVPAQRDPYQPESSDRV
ncbi:hypothetical protein [Halovenus aranensis]|uniref:hypothetical protein n=1 Tax=Halovenus aranensis TaxID=890420 RepID=UPI00117AD13B|nr:hypothetical protein [Halovenus aranensis]